MVMILAEPLVPDILLMYPQGLRIPFEGPYAGSAMIRMLTERSSWFGCEVLVEISEGEEGLV